MLVAKNKTEELILNHLQKVAATEPKFEEKLKTTNKTLFGCMNYLKNRAKDQADENVAMVDDGTVFGWATHYFDEDSIEETSINKINAKVEVSPKKQINVESKKDKCSILNGQLTLFDL